MKIEVPRQPARGHRQASREPPNDRLAGELVLPNYLDVLNVTLALATARQLRSSGDADPEDLYGDFA